VEEWLGRVKDGQKCGAGKRVEKATTPSTN
jgi:hypothetical protein